MLMNILPGLRELRAPLVSGYLWLVSAWLFLGSRGWLPVERPRGNGEVARLWDLGGTLGKTVVLAVATFIAYLIGSFLEMDPDGRIARRLAPLVLADRRPWYLPRLNSRRMVKHPALQTVLANARRVAQSFSQDARRDLVRLMSQRTSIIGSSDQKPRIDIRELASLIRDYHPKFETRERELLLNIGADQKIPDIIEEMPQLASRLLVKNQDLYGKYDRHMAEAAVRINVSIPLTLFLLLGTWLSGLPTSLRWLLTFVALAVGVLLLRQGFLRTVSARDVIAQALSIDQVESSHIPSKKKAEGPTEEPEGSKEPRVRIGELEAIQDENVRPGAQTDKLARPRRPRGGKAPSTRTPPST